MGLGQKKVQYIGTASPPMEASFDSDCAGPDEDTIDQGEQIVMVDGEAWHRECAEKAGYRVLGE